MTAHILAVIVGVALLAIGVVGLAAYLAQTCGHDLVAHALSETGIQNAARTAESPQQPSVRACSVAFCTDPVEVVIGAGYDEWPFCLGHGTPYLRTA